MEIGTAMVENLDHHIGRLIRYPKDKGEDKKTFIFFFMSDDGAEGDRRHAFIDEFDYNSYENLGCRGLSVTYGPHWAEVGTAPIRLWKPWGTEGGVSTPVFVCLRRQLNPQPPLTQIATVRDVALALLTIAGAPDPGDIFQGRGVNPVTGASLLSMLELRTPNRIPKIKSWGGNRKVTAISVKAITGWCIWCRSRSTTTS